MAQREKRAERGSIFFSVSSFGLKTATDRNSIEGKWKPVQWGNNQNALKWQQHV
jgi:hypothetical protein